MIQLLATPVITHKYEVLFKNNDIKATWCRTDDSNEPPLLFLLFTVFSPLKPQTQSCYKAASDIYTIWHKEPIQLCCKVICLVIIMHMNSGAITLAGLYFCASSLSVIRNPYVNRGGAKEATRVGEMRTEAVGAHFVSVSTPKSVNTTGVCRCSSSRSFKETVPRE